ncbi:MAG: carboxypeptidase regulatory-like domain-containing protein, partial [Blastocatellia bacterium]|nr:carboxypeptidase regulatory-like domain-containing protein [Blastocatellia bacterium]
GRTWIVRITLQSLIIILMLAASNDADAYACLYQHSICESAASAEAIFVGTVDKVESLKSVQIAHIRVEDVFKGKIGPEVAIRSRMITCGFSYRAGEQWLFYASYDKENEAWSDGDSCGRSKLAKYAANDLLYLRRLPASSQQTRISGSVEYQKTDPQQGIVGKSMSDVKVEIIGEHLTVEVKTDRNGIYEIYGLLPGRYQIEPEAPPGWTERFPIRMTDADGREKEGAEVELDEKSCAELNFSYFIDAETSIAGKVRGADGQPLPNMLLGLQPKGKLAQQSWQFVSTNNQGDYQLKNIAPGEYLIFVKGNGDISSYAPFLKAYYPGVFKEKDGAVVKVTRGDRLENYDIDIPPQTTTHTIQGKLLDADGRPVGNGYVQFKADKVEEGIAGEVRTKTDAQGRFSLNILQGLDGRLYGFIDPAQGEYANCQSLLKSVGDSASLETEPLQLEITADLQDVELRFSIVPCK